MKSFYLALATALVWGLVPVIEKIGLSRLSPQAGIFVRCLAVAAGAGVLLAFKPGIIAELTKTQPLYIVLIMVGGFVANFLGQLLFYSALKGGEVSRVVPIAGAYPLIAFVTGILILGEKLTMIKSLGVGCVLVGIFLLK
jgi:transporter family protein